MAVECPFREGCYIIEEAYIVPSDGSQVAVAMTEAVLTVEPDIHGRIFVHGSGFVRNAALVTLLEDHDSLDIIMKMGEGLCYHLTKPTIHAGKVFSQQVQSRVRFTPNTSFNPISDERFNSWGFSLI